MIMKKILYIELCNFVDYPLGGHLSFAIHLATAMSGDMDIVGVRTDRLLPVGTWVVEEFCDFRYNFFNLANIKKDFNKPLIPERIKNYFRIKRYINKILSHNYYEIIIVQTPEVLFSIPQKVLPKVCLIMPGVGNPLKISRYPYVRRFAFLYEKFFFRYAKHVNIILAAADSIAIGEFVNRSRGAISLQHVFSFPTRYDANIFRPIEREKARVSIGIDNDSLVIVTTGRLNWYKGWRFMIDSFVKFYQNHPSSYFYFIGQGEDKDKIEDYLIDIGLDDKVLLVGVKSSKEVSLYLNAADLYVMGSYTEGWSTSLVEAVACSVPCVVTKFSSAYDLVKNGENGFVVDNRDENIFAFKMEDALKLNKTTLNKISNNAYKMSVQAMREQLNSFLKFE